MGNNPFEQFDLEAFGDGGNSNTLPTSNSLPQSNPFEEFDNEAYNIQPTKNTQANIIPKNNKVSRGEALGRGALQGATFNFADELSALPATAIDLAASTYYGEKPSISQSYDRALTETRKQDKKAQSDRSGYYLGGQVAGTLGTGIGLASTAPAKALGNVIRTGKIAGKSLGTAGRVLGGATGGAVSGGLYGLGEGEGLQDRAKKAQESAIFGGVVGGVIPGVASTVIPSISKELAPLVQKARDFNIPLSGDQVAKSRVRNTIQKVSQEIPFSGQEAFRNKQLTQYNKAVASTIGENTDNLSPEVINSFLTKSSEKFNTVLKGKVVNFNKNDLQTLLKVAEDAKSNITLDYVNLVENNIINFGKLISKGQVNGNQLSSYRSDLVKRLPKVAGDARKYIGDLIDIIDNKIDEVATPEEIAKLGQARRQWRNFKTLEPLLEKSTDGRINPTQLLNRVAQSPYIKASRAPVGEDVLVDLARIGKEFLPVKGGSDTFQKAALGGVATSSYYNPLTIPIAGAVAGVNRAFQGINRSQRFIDLALKMQSGKKILPKEIGSLAPKEAQELIKMQKTKNYTPIQRAVSNNLNNQER